MVQRVSDSATFEALRKRARRVRCGPVSVAYHRAEDTPLRVAYAVGRKTGGAVERNRVRRRLRAAVSEVSGEMRPGAYMLSAGREALSLPYRDLKAAVAGAMTSASKNRGS